MAKCANLIDLFADRDSSIAATWFSSSKSALRFCLSEAKTFSILLVSSLVQRSAPPVTTRTTGSASSLFLRAISRSWAPFRILTIWTRLQPASLRISLNSPSSLSRSIKSCTASTSSSCKFFATSEAFSSVSIHFSTKNLKRAVEESMASSSSTSAVCKTESLGAKVLAPLFRPRLSNRSLLVEAMTSLLAKNSSLISLAISKTWFACFFQSNGLPELRGWIEQTIFEPKLSESRTVAKSLPSCTRRTITSFPSLPTSLSSGTSMYMEGRALE
mmetsp:Transcript_4627/g.8565  ORF Transcript_4627/g.8565 Transcript_4627/m.8565 type:complete len:273 (-) Transcript_4627:387-1205(-)